MTVMCAAKNLLSLQGAQRLNTRFKSAPKKVRFQFAERNLQPAGCVRDSTAAGQTAECCGRLLLLLIGGSLQIWAAVKAEVSVGGTG